MSYPAQYGTETLASASPAPATLERSVSVPGGAVVTVRLVYRKGVEVDPSLLPKAFLIKDTLLEKKVAGFDDLSPEGKRWALQALWPKDRWRESGVTHYVAYPELESIWLLSALFCGSGQRHDQLAAYNSTNPEKMRFADIWEIPKNLLGEDLGGEKVEDGSKAEAALDDEARTAAHRALLTYPKDAKTPYVVYHLRKGEALYSSVVLRYTDRVEAREVNELAQTLADYNRIASVHHIQPGAPIKIPIEYLASPFQVEGSKALAEERSMQAEVKRTTIVDGGPRLKGVHIVLDPGHGGVDVGAKANRAWESDFVFDIAMRVQRLLTQHTDAQTHCTVDFPGLSSKIRDQITSPTRASLVMTNPPIANDGEYSSATSVHLRWVLANDLFVSNPKQNATKTLFISFHADSLHPLSRGTMVYVPGASKVPSSFALGARRTLNVAQARKGARVAFTERERIQGEARSRLFANQVLKALRKKGIAVHANRPVRNVIHRGRRSYVPAVIRHNVAATKILLEVVNLTNEEDARNILDPQFRERYAEALVEGIRTFYKGS